MTDIPEPHVRRFPNKHGVKRDVSVSFSTWVGVGMGATHYYVKIQEEWNRLWDGEGHWAKPWDDDGGEGKYFHEEFDFPYQCKDYAHKIIAEHFSDGKHSIRWQGMESYHLYKREGD